MAKETNRQNVAFSCPHCGKQTYKDGSFCSSCGKSLKTFCKKCNNVVNSGNNCSSCGASLSEEPKVKAPSKNDLAVEANVVGDNGNYIIAIQVTKNGLGVQSDIFYSVGHETFSVKTDNNGFHKTEAISVKFIKKEVIIRVCGTQMDITKKIVLDPMKLKPILTGYFWPDLYSGITKKCVCPHCRTRTSQNKSQCDFCHQDLRIFCKFGYHFPADQLTECPIYKKLVSDPPEKKSTTSGIAYAAGRIIGDSNYWAILFIFIAIIITIQAILFGAGGKALLEEEIKSGVAQVKQPGMVDGFIETIAPAFGWVKEGSKENLEAEKAIVKPISKDKKIENTDQQGWLKRQLSWTVIILVIWPFAIIFFIFAMRQEIAAAWEAAGNILSRKTFSDTERVKGDPPTTSGESNQKTAREGWTLWKELLSEGYYDAIKEFVKIIFKAIPRKMKF